MRSCGFSGKGKRLGAWSMECNTLSNYIPHVIRISFRMYHGKYIHNLAVRFIDDDVVLEIATAITQCAKFWIPAGRAGFRMFS